MDAAVWAAIGLLAATSLGTLLSSEPGSTGWVRGSTAWRPGWTRDSIAWMLASITWRSGSTRSRPVWIPVSTGIRAAAAARSRIADHRSRLVRRSARPRPPSSRERHERVHHLHRRCGLHEAALVPRNGRREDELDEVQREAAVMYVGAHAEVVQVDPLGHLGEDGVAVDVPDHRTRIDVLAGRAVVASGPPASLVPVHGRRHRRPFG